MAKKYKIYLTIRKDKEGKPKGWFIVDKKSPVDLQFKTKKEALTYVKENYNDVTVMVQNEHAKFQYTIVLENKQVVSFVSKDGKDSDDHRETSKDIERVFKYTVNQVVVEKETIEDLKSIKTMVEDIQIESHKAENDKVSKGWIITLSIGLAVAIIMSIVSIALLAS